MPRTELPRFKTFQDWHNFVSNNPPLDGLVLAQYRKNCYKDIEALRGNPLIVYATKFLDVPPNTPNTINLADIDGFTDLVNSVNDSNEIDVLLHSPGGYPDATERIVNILRSKFQRVNFLIPHSAYSAATMLAMSGNSIIMHPSATLGPIDPQIDGIPARSIKRGFENAKEKIKNEGPESLPAYIPLIEKYSLDKLELCDDSEKLAKILVSDWLKKYMFSEEEINDSDIQKISDYLSNYDEHLLHSRPLMIDSLKEFKLKIEKSSPELTDLLWEVNILLSGFFGLTGFYKLYENSENVSWGRQFRMITPPQPTPTPTPNQSNS